MPRSIHLATWTNSWNGSCRRSGLSDWRISDEKCPHELGPFSRISRSFRVVNIVRTLYSLVIRTIRNLNGSVCWDDKPEQERSNAAIITLWVTSTLPILKCHFRATAGLSLTFEGVPKKAFQHLLYLKKPCRKYILWPRLFHSIAKPNSECEEGFRLNISTFLHALASGPECFLQPRSCFLALWTLSKRHKLSRSLCQQLKYNYELRMLINDVDIVEYGFGIVRFRTGWSKVVGLNKLCLLPFWFQTSIRFVVVLSLAFLLRSTGQILDKRLTTSLQGSFPTTRTPCSEFLSHLKQFLLAPRNWLVGSACVVASLLWPDDGCQRVYAFASRTNDMATCDVPSQYLFDWRTSSISINALKLTSATAMSKRNRNSFASITSSLECPIFMTSPSATPFSCKIYFIEPVAKPRFVESSNPTPASL